MSKNNEAPGLDSASKQRRLRTFGVIVLLLGIGGAGIVYWMGTRSSQSSDDPSMSGYNRAERRQMGMLYGKSGLLIDDLFDDLTRPGIQATIIAIISVLVASGCFHLARPLNENDEPG